MKKKVYNEDGKNNVKVTKPLPGNQWLKILINADCRVEVCQDLSILTKDQIIDLIGNNCQGAIGQLTEPWDKELFEALKQAGGKVYSNYAVGFNNLDVQGATELGLPLGNTPGVLTETTAEMAATLTFAAARRVGEAERFIRRGQFMGWLPELFLGTQLQRSCLGIIGAGRIGEYFAKMMISSCYTDLIYYDPYPNPRLEKWINDFNDFLSKQGEKPVTCKRAEHTEELYCNADIISLHPILNESTHHMINATSLKKMKTDAILINVGRGPLIDEKALVSHCQTHPEFKVGLDVFEDEPVLAPGLLELQNVVIVPHIASATTWTRQGMAILAAANVAGILQGYPVNKSNDVRPFLSDNPPKAAASIINAKELGL